MMLYKLIPPPSVKATIQLPASKSISNRALIINALGKGIYSPENLSDCDDTQVMIKALTEGQETIDIMAAGTAMRFLTAYLSVTPGERIITGTARMQQRPIQILVNALRELGAEIEYVHKEGYPPLRIKGSVLKGNEITLKGNVSSQYISALLMIAPYMKFERRNYFPSLYKPDTATDAGFRSQSRMDLPQQYFRSPTILQKRSFQSRERLECSFLLVSDCHIISRSGN